MKHIDTYPIVDTYPLVLQWAQRIGATRLSQWLHNTPWVVPTSQSIHIISLSMVFGSALMINLRLLGVGRSGRSVSELTAALVPWIYAGLAVLLVTGTLQTLSEPERQLAAAAFWWKMLMIVCVWALTVRFARAVRHDPVQWNQTVTRPPGARLFALVSLGLWLGIIYCGRLID